MDFIADADPIDCLMGQLHVMRCLRRKWL